MKLENTRNRSAVVTLCFALLALCLNAHARNAPRVGVLGGGSLAANANRIDAFRHGLRDLGYVEGKSIIIDQRWAGEK